MFSQAIYGTVLGVCKSRGAQIICPSILVIDTCGIEETFFLPPPLSPSRSRVLLLYVADCIFKEGRFLSPHVGPRFVIYVDLIRFLGLLLSS